MYVTQLPSVYVLVSDKPKFESWLPITSYVIWVINQKYWTKLHFSHISLFIFSWWLEYEFSFIWDHHSPSHCTDSVFSPRPSCSLLQERRTPAQLSQRFQAIPANNVSWMLDSFQIGQQALTGRIWVEACCFKSERDGHQITKPPFCNQFYDMWN